MMADGLRDAITVRTLFDDRVPRREEVSVMESPAKGRLRIWLCMGLFGMAFLVLLGRLAHVSFGMAEEMRLIRAETSPPPRAQVVDRNGRPLIMNTAATGLAVDGRDIWDVEEVVTALTAMFPSTDASRLRQRLLDKQYALVTESITPEERHAVISLGLPGMKFPDTTGRAYPQKDLAAHVVGYTIPGRGGAIGVEKALDDTILATDGRVALSIDLVAQQVLEDELASAMQTYSAKAAWGVLLDAKSGEVRALASLPDFNPNRPAVASVSAWRNRAMSDVYELGSAFKPITIAAALDAGVVNMSERFEVSQPIEVGGWEIDDYSRKKHPLTVSEIIQYSSNVGTIRVVQRLGVERFKATLSSLGLVAPLKTELPEARSPMVSKTWRPSELASSSYGHGIAVSPLQLAASFAAVINGGTYRTPTFVSGGHVVENRAFSEQTSARMRIILRKTVTEGTGKNAEAMGFYPIGKTATADKPGVGGYDDDGELVSSFIGAFPGYDPQYVLLVSLDEPEGTKATYGFATAGYVAAPVFKRVVERVAPALGIMPVGDDVAFDGFVGLRREGGGATPVENDALAALLAEAVY